MKDLWDAMEEALRFFTPSLIAALVIALVAALALNSHFTSGKTLAMRWLHGTAYFLVFSTFGVVVAFFLSLGIAEANGAWINPLVSGFSTPLIALLTAGVTYFANKEAPEAATETGTRTPVGIVPAGVTCFLLGASLCYKNFLLIVVHG